LGDVISAPEGDGQARSTADAVARRSYSKLVAFLAARTGDVAAAEDALSEAFASALIDWPRKGCPANPEGWLLTAARRKIIDESRRQRRGEIAAGHWQLLAEGLDAAAANPDIPDHRLALMFACAHPAIDAAIRAPLMLQAVLGVDAATIASAFLVSPTTMGQRLVRAKTKIRQARIPFTVPEREELPGRLGAVLDAIYAAFAEGWADPGGTDVARRDLAEEAMFLGSLVAELLPAEPEALGLLALMLHAEARRRASQRSGRIRAAGRPGSVPVGLMDDQRRRGVVAAGRDAGLDRALSARSSTTIHPRSSPPHWRGQLAGGGAAL
jgi:predicted RNA polymerase sigma factor